MLVDEVLSVGDAQFRAKAVRAMKERIGGEHKVVFVAHMDLQIEELCDRAVLLDSDKVRVVGDSKEVLQAYRNRIKPQS